MAGDIALIVIFFVASFAMVILEICTPTFGIASVLSLAALVASVYVCFHISQTVGIIGTVAAVVFYPAFIIVMVKKLPNTTLGRMLSLKRDRASPGEGTPEADEMKALVGRTAIADSLLRPSGAIMIDGNRYIAQAESTTIEKGAKVRIIRSAGTHVVVRKEE